MEYSFLKKDEIFLLHKFLNAARIKSDKEKNSWKFFENSIVEGNPGVLITTTRENGNIISASGCYAISSAWGKPINILPYWVTGITRNIETKNIIGDRIDKMLSPASLYFESLGLNAFFMSRLLSANITYSNCDLYLERLSAKIGIYRYKCSIERIIDDKNGYDNLSNFYKVFAHDAWPEHKKLVLLRYDLAYKERK